MAESQTPVLVVFAHDTLARYIILFIGIIRIRTLRLSIVMRRPNCGQGVNRGITSRALGIYFKRKTSKNVI